MSAARPTVPSRGNGASSHDATAGSPSRSTNVPQQHHSGGGASGNGPPSIRCAERMRQLILRAAPSALHTIGDVLRFAVQQNFSDDQVIRQLAQGLGVEMHGWPKDPVARRRLRVERFYQFNNVPIDTRRIEAALASPHTEEELIQALYNKYQRNEIGESLDPDIALGESLLHLFACTNPAMMGKVHSFVVEQAQSGLTHAEYLEEVCKALGVCTDGWPLDPDERLRKRLESFYRLNDAKKMDRVDILMRREFSDEEIFSALYDKYGRDELGQPVQNERLLREQLVRLLQPTQAEHKVNELLQYKKDRRLTDVELVHAVRKMLKVGDDGLPLDPTERLRTRVRMYFRANSSLKPPTADYVATGGSGDGQSQSQQPPQFSAPNRRFPPPPRYKPDPPLLTQDELDELHASNDVLDALLQDELLRIRLHRNDRSSDGTEGVGTSSAGDRGGTGAASETNAGGGNSPLLSRLKRRVSNFFVARRKSTTGGGGGEGGGDVETLLAVGDSSGPSSGLLGTVTTEEEEAILARLCVRFQRNEVGEVLLPAVERERIRLDLVQYLERFVVPGREVVAVATDIAQLHLSEANMWEVARHQYGAQEEHTAHTAFRNHLMAMFQRCAPRDLAKVPMMMVCMFEDDLTPDEVLATVQHKYRVDRDGWPVGDPLARRRTQLSMLFQRHDPQKLPLIESLFVKLPADGDDDRLYQRLCASYGADELGRPVVRSDTDDAGAGQYDPLDASGKSEMVSSKEGALAGRHHQKAPSGVDSQLLGETMVTSTSMSSTSGGGGTPGGLSGNSPLRTSTDGAPCPAPDSPPSMLWPASVPRRSGVEHSVQQGNQSGLAHAVPPNGEAAPTNGRPVERRFQRQPKVATLHNPTATTLSASGESFYGPLRALRARDQWNGDAAAADVAAVIGEDFLRELQQKYGAGAPQQDVQYSSQAGRSGVAAAATAPPPQHHSLASAMPTSPNRAAPVGPAPTPRQPVAFQSRVTSPFNAMFENPVEKMRHNVTSTLDLLRADARRNSIQQSHGKRVVATRDADGGGAGTASHRYKVLSTDWSMFLPEEPLPAVAAGRYHMGGGKHRGPLTWAEDDE